MIGILKRMANALLLGVAGTVATILVIALWPEVPPLLVALGVLVPIGAGLLIEPARMPWFKKKLDIEAELAATDATPTMKETVRQLDEEGQRRAIETLQNRAFMTVAEALETPAPTDPATVLRATLSDEAIRAVLVDKADDFFLAAAEVARDDSRETPLDDAHRVFENICALMETFDVDCENEGYYVAQIGVATAERALALGEPVPAYIEDYFPETPFVFQKREQVACVFPLVRITSTKTESVWQAGSQGFSIRIAKGLSYRIGAARGHRVSQEVKVDLGAGPAAVTNKHFYYVTDGLSRRISLLKIVSVAREGTSVKIVKEAARPKPLYVRLPDEKSARVLALYLREGGE